MKADIIPLIIYFLCTGNSCRSQMAEGYGKKFLKGLAEVYSSGVEAHGLNPKTVAIMKEDGVDISHQKSKAIDVDLAVRADYIITLCGDAKDRCPHVANPKATKLHWDLPDPAKAQGSEKEVTAVFRKVRNEIKRRILLLKDDLT